MIISIGAEKVIDKVPHISITKSLKKIGVEGIQLNIRKVVNKQTHRNIIPKRETLKHFLSNKE
jgi:hypothetical protein